MVERWFRTGSPFVRFRDWKSEDGREGVRLYLFCPACEDLHGIEISDQNTRWQWNGDTVQVAVSPSIKVEGVQWDKDSSFHKPHHNVHAGQRVVCHSFVKQGQWQFLDDCTHGMAGRTVPLVAIPDGLFEDKYEKGSG